MTPTMLSSDAREFRARIIDACWDNKQFGYVDADVFVGSCPICRAALGVHFTFATPRAVLTCYGGCTETEIATALGLGICP